MEFGNNVDTNEKYVTLHSLARELNRPERQIRYRFHALRKEGKLAEGEDFTKQDFVDEHHFEYRINPLRFIEEAKLHLETPVANKLPGFDSNLSPNESGVDNNPQIQDEPVDTKDQQSVTKPDNKVVSKSELDNDSITKFVDNDMLFDYIDTLKGQLKVKDAQIDSYRKKTEDDADLQRRTIGELLKAHEQLRQITAGRTDESQAVHDAGQRKDYYEADSVGYDESEGEYPSNQSSETSQEVEDQDTPVGARLP